MPENPKQHSNPVPEESPGATFGYGPWPLLGLRGTVGGILMGLANLVPGISGGTMLVASGIYPFFIEGISDITRLRFRARSLFVLGVIVLSAVASIALLSGTVRDLVVSHRWAMYSLFIGLTFGGVPVVWGMVQRAIPATYAGAVVGFVFMAALVVAEGDGAGGEATDPSFMLLFLAGLAGASAMVLPGISGGYLLLVLGVYTTILSGISAFKSALLGGDMGATMEVFTSIILPVGLGVVIGVVAVSNVLRRLFDRYEQPTLGLLLGFLVGSPLGLYPFRVGRAPEVGSTFRGQAVTPEFLRELAPHKYPTESFTPETWQIGASLGLVLAGFALTALLAKFGARGTSGIEAAGAERMSLPPRDDDPAG